MIGQTDIRIADLDGKLFTTLRPYLPTGETQWRDPVDIQVASLITSQMSRQYKSLPFQRHGDHIFVAAIDTHSPAALAITEFIEGKVILCRVEEEDLTHAQDRVFGLLSGLHDEKIGSYLLASGRLSPEELAGALQQQSAENSGARLGAILMQRGSVTHWDIAEATARQQGLPLIDLLHADNMAGVFDDIHTLDAWDLVNERFWYRHLTVPLSSDGTTLTVAMVDVDDVEAQQILERLSGRRLRLFITGYRDVMAVLNTHFRASHEEASRLELFRRQPDDSAYRQISRPQAYCLLGLLTAIVAGFILNPLMSGVIIAGIIEVLYASVSIFRLWAMAKAASNDSEVIVTDADMENILPTSLPEYTVLVPLYKEAAVLPTLTKAIADLEYPKDRLDVKLLLEEDDLETIDAARQANLPAYMELLIVPQSEPRTKPKACNYGLSKARGEYVVIFDAEDIPEPDQLLKAITVFRQSDDNRLACVQAKLSYYNENQNILTRWFTAEYANWFELLLPSLFSFDMPIPLGGTSNHFRTNTLLELGAWDPFNVAEDADLGIRLHKAGYRTAIMNSVTFEEANSDFVNWIRQRSRWVKGYLQTWLVHMRHPIKLWRELGTVGYVGFQMTVGGTPLQFLVNPLLWALTVIWILFEPSYLQQVFSGWVYYLGNLCLFVGNVAFTYSNVVGVIKSGRPALAKWAILSPVYWMFMSIAAYKALNQLIFKPSYWEKTIHGLNKNGDVSINTSAQMTSNFTAT